MILVDISSIMHRMIFGSTKHATSKVDGKFVTKEFIPITLYYIISELIDIQIKYQQYGEVVICFDDYKKAYWRRDVYPLYKHSRRVDKPDDNPINYSEIFQYTNELFEQITKNLPWKCVYVNRAEADDLILVLAKEYYEQGILIHSPDKDFIQSQRLPNIVQWSSLTKKWILPENKFTDMKEWIHYHTILGDGADGVPRVIDHTEFSEAFKEHLTKLDIALDVKSFKNLSIDKKTEALSTFNEHTYNKKGQETGLDVYESKSFGSSHIDKIKSGYWKRKNVKEELQAEAKILRANKKLASKEDKLRITEELKTIKAKIDTLEETITGTEEYFINDFLDSHPLYREHYERNFTLVMEEGIPDYIRTNVLMEYNQASTEYNESEFCKYLDDNGLYKIKSLLPKVFKSSVSKLDISNCGW